jgi:acyl-CoA thioester hydrolase
MTAPFHITQSIYSEDVDQYGIVYHSNYLKYFERARTEWLLSKGLTLTQLIEENCCFVIRRATIDFTRSLKLHDRFTIDCQINNTTRTTLLFKQVITECTSNIISCEAEIKLVTINTEGKIIKIPPAIKDILS